MPGVAHNPRDEEVLARIESRVGAHAGLCPPAWVLAARVQDRVRRLGLDSLEAYEARLEGAPGRVELDALAECLRVGETSFFRHAAHIGALRRVVGPDLAQHAATRPDRKVRAWSAGCATGEEAYTLAILLGEALPAERGYAVEILATDISEPALEIARARVYDAEALRHVPALTRERCFEPAQGGQRVRDELAGRVRFARRNLLDAIYPREQDVILCRNVLIYFDAATRVRTVERLIESLAAGGYLFLGYAESLREFERLEALRTPDGVIYRKPRGERPKAVAPTATATPTPSPPRRAPSPTRPPVPQELVVTPRGSHDDGARIAAELKAALAGSARRVVVALDEVDYLDDAVAPVLRRALAAAQAAGQELILRAERPGPLRWLSRHGFKEQRS